MSRIGQRVVFHGFLEVDQIQALNTVFLPLQECTDFREQGALRVLSIRIEKKVNYFYEVTTSD